MNNPLSELMETNLHHVWNERDAARRMNVIKALYMPDSSLYEMGETTIGHEAINNQVTSLLNSFPDDFTFTIIKPIQINGNVGRLVWGVGPRYPAYQAHIFRLSTDSYFWQKTISYGSVRKDVRISPVMA